MRIPVTVAVKGGRPSRFQAEIKNRESAQLVLSRLEQARELLESRGKPPERVGGEDMVGPEGAAALMEVSTLEQLVQLQDAVWGIALGKVPDDVPPSRWPAKAAGQLRAVEMLLDRMMGKPIQRQQVAAVHRIVVERG